MAAYVLNTREAAKRAYAEAGVRDPATELSLTEVHDCFSITELVTMEDLGLSEEGRAPRDILDGRYDRDGRAAVPDRRRAQMLRPSGRRLGPAHGL